ncbi:DMT family transporter [Ideonella oryzae]|uniref:DMT family transporter n=1 Tax=Ideonella oryzae TaxID=2937441 RepID=A0ABT1BPV4_9BURK|nr:DMT family transporter [Ideonella oryzae]MCO5977944.1 DMT family transporter [Ideonella oryzae]
MTPVAPMMSHRRAVATMVLATLLWSIAGVVTRHLDSAASFEVTFWRSAANALAMVVLLAWQMGPRALWRSLHQGGAVLWWSGLGWGVMYTAFMVALTLTTVANVLITEALSPLLTALIARFVLRQQLPLRTWVAIAMASGGIAWMHASHVAGGDLRHLLGTGLALLVPLCSALVWVLMQVNARRATERQQDLSAAVLIGAVLSAAVSLPLAWPLQASAHDMQLLSLLGVVQLAIPCVMAVAAGRVLKAPEASLLGQLEIVFGVAWTWLGTAEAPTPAVLGGGLLVLGALTANEGLALWRSRATAARG